MRHTIIIFTLLSLILAGCAGIQQSPASEPSTTDDASSSTTAFTIVDSRDRRVQFDRPPDRILVSGKANLMIIEAIYLFEGASDRMPALPKAGQRNVQVQAFLSVLDPAYEDKTQFVWSASGEQIAAFNPDVVLLKSFMADQVGKALEQLGIPVVYVDLETPEQYVRDLKILGQLLDEPDRLDEILDFYDSRQGRIAQGVGGLGEEEKPSALLLQYSEEGGEVAFNVPPASWTQTTLIERGGGRPVWKDAAQGGGWVVVNFEQIAAWNPDKIFIVNYFGSVEDVVNGLKEDPQWQNLAAVQQEELYGFPKDYYSWDQPDPRWILGLTWLATTMHPAEFSDLEMEAELFRFFGEMYSLEEGVVEQAILPQVEGDWK